MFCRITCSTLTLGLLLAGATAHAETESTEGRDVSFPTIDTTVQPDAPASLAKHDVALQIDPTVLLPVGNLGNSTGPALGAFAGVEYRTSSHVSITARVGFLAGLGAQVSAGPMTITSSLNEFPLMVGFKYFPSGEGFYLGGEGGPMIVTSTVTISGAQDVLSGLNGTQSNSSLYFGGSAGAGYRAEPFDVRAGLFVLDASHPDQTSALMASASWAFAGF